MIQNDSSATDYFARMSQALNQAGAHKPTLVIDKQRLDTNLDALLAVIQTGFDYRIVAKSLPSAPLLKYIMQRSGSNRLMSFHMPFLQHVIEQLPQADILLGKPMPVASVRQFYQWLPSLDSTTFKPEQQLHWLVDSLERLQQYQDLASELNCPLNINLELDVGLHRGGFNADNQKQSAELIQALNLLNTDKNLTLTGLMGYEAHVSKIPKLIGGANKAFTIAMRSYQACLQQVINVFGQDVCDGLILNAGGSSTYPLYNKADTQSQCINEIATASALVKPTDFDVPTLKHHIPACFIATPVLKLVTNPEIPMLKGLSSLLRTIGVLPKQACFIYGGNWLASPCFPAGSKRSTIFGHSSNQEMYELKAQNLINMDDYLYFRPAQSEAIFLQFGNIAVFEDDRIIDWWPVFHPASSDCKENNNFKEIA